jgi:putative DNA-invertase from lambdoid prophage Rac
VGGVNVVLYSRVSTDEQTVDPQRDELRAEAKRRGWTIVAEIEDVISGDTSSRKGLDQLMKLVRRRAIKAVLCYKLDRLGRSLTHLVQTIAEFDAFGVALVCTSQGIDTSDSNPAGRLTMHILAAISEFERSLIRDRTRAGLRAARARGARLGRPRTPLPVDHQEIVARWRRDTGGKGYRELAARLGIKNPGTAFRLAGAAAGVVAGR